MALFTVCEVYQYSKNSEKIESKAEKIHRSNSQSILEKLRKSYLGWSKGGKSPILTLTVKIKLTKFNRPK